MDPFEMIFFLLENLQKAVNPFSRMEVICISLLAFPYSFSDD